MNGNMRLLMRAGMLVSRRLPGDGSAREVRDHRATPRRNRIITRLLFMARARNFRKSWQVDLDAAHAVHESGLVVHFVPWTQFVPDQGNYHSRAHGLGGAVWGGNPVSGAVEGPLMSEAGDVYGRAMIMQQLQAPLSQLLRLDQPPESILPPEATSVHTFARHQLELKMRREGNRIDER